MLSAGRGLQLGQTHGGTRTIPWTNSIISGKEGWLLFISLFILISLPHGTAWPHGKRLAKVLYLHYSSLFLFVWLSLLVYVLCSQKAGISALSIPSSPLSFKSTAALSKACKRRPTERQ